MNEKMKELQQKMNSTLALAKAFMDGEDKDVEKANAKMEEYKALEAEYNAAKAIYEAEKADAENKAAMVKPVGSTEGKKSEKPVDSTKAFADAARNGFKKDMSEGVAGDGGYTVPEDIRTRIETLRDAKYSLRQDVTVERVTTLSGRRTIKQRAQQAGFTKVLEGGAIPKKTTPTFTVLNYTVEKYAGYFAVTNELLADSDANIVNVLTNWIADEARVTDNKQILAAISTGWSTPTKFADLDAIKKALNVTLGQAFKPTSKIFTNDDGLQWLDTLKDGVGRDLLQPDPTAPANMRIRVGATTIPVKVLPNSDFPSTTAGGKTKIPFIVGDMKEAIVLFDRKQLSIMSSNTASTTDVNAFEEDLTLWRAIERLDVVQRDPLAIVNGYVEISAS